MFLSLHGLFYTFLYVLELYMKNKAKTQGYIAVALEACLASKQRIYFKIS